ncbi:MAG: hypothetical protein QM270_02520 [Bacillota bacterium]|nr:hypothetical protein [Bacillota bacterium]
MNGGLGVDWVWSEDARRRMTGSTEQNPQNVQNFRSAQPKPVQPVKFAHSTPLSVQNFRSAQPKPAQPVKIAHPEVNSVSCWHFSPSAGPAGGSLQPRMLLCVR